jgi:hypothetical protein
MRTIRLAPGESGAERLRLERQIDEYLRRPVRQKAWHRLNFVTRICDDCGLTEKAIALNEYEPCFEVTNSLSSLAAERKGGT